jgi:DNA-binding transcriptional MocR family regulator
MQSIQGAPPHCLDTTYTSQPNAVHALVDTPREYQLVSLLISYRWFSTSPIIPSVRTLADTMKCSERTVRRTVAALVARGLLYRVERRAEDSRQMSNEYVLCGELLAAVTAVEASTGRGGGHERRPTLSAATGKPNQRKYANRSSTRERQSPIPTAASAYLQTSRGTLKRR